MQDRASLPSPTPDDRVAAAVAASAWIRRRREAWAAGGPALPPLRVALPTSREATPVADPPAAVRPFDIPQPAATQPERRTDPPRAEAVREHPKVPIGAAVASRTRSLARGFADLVVEWWRPLASTVAIVALVAGGAWGLRAGWHYVTVTLRTGTATFDSVPEGAGVSVDGIVVGQTPLTRQLTVGRHMVEFRTRKATRVVPLDVSARGQNVARVDWAAKPMGHLHVETSPDGARVFVDGSERGVSPLTIDLPVGAHAVVLRNESGSIQRSVNVAEDKTIEVSEGIYAGFVRVTSTIDLAIYEGPRLYVQDDRHQALLPAGPHVLQLRNRDLEFSETRRVEIVPGEVFNVTVNPTSSLTVTANVPARVSIDGTDAGDAPVTDNSITLGTREVVVKSNTGGERRASVRVTTAPARLDVDFSKP